MTKTAIALGGNLGNVEHTFHSAIRQLTDGGLRNIRTSPVMVTRPEQCVPGTPDFHNGALVGEWPGTARELLELCQHIERRAGRPRRHSSAESRTLDLDLILFGEEQIQSDILTIPHPRAQRRRFVLDGLAKIAPDWKFPDSGRTVQEALELLS